MSPVKVADFISHLMTALSGCGLYSERHPVFTEYTEKAAALLKDLYSDGSVSFLMIGDSLIVNEAPFTEKNFSAVNFLKRLKKKRIEKIVIREGIDTEEFRQFATQMASRESIAASPHISVGIIEIKLKTSAVGAPELLGKGMSAVRNALQGTSRFRQLDMISLEGAVLDFISTLKKEMNVLRIITPVKSHNEYTYVHATNVAVLTLFQAEALGLTGEALHDIGLAGLLHDVGKMFVPATVLDKRSALTPEEWDEMKKHPAHGAAYLSRMREVPPLAPIVAFEHHMKYNGSGYPDTKRIARKQHIVSQMVSIADFFDALRTERPYRKSLDVQTVTGLLKEAAGRDFNPLLVDSFLSALSRVSEGM